MGKSAILLVTAILLVAFALPAGPPLVLAEGSRQAMAEWTIMVYLDGDNDLEALALVDFNEMEAVGSSNQVNVLVQLDRIPGEYDGEGGWTEARRYYVTRDQNPNAIGSVELANLGEVNMGDPATLADFIAWGITSYPARRYALIIWDHGSGWSGISYDFTNGNDPLNLPELQQGIGSGLQRAGVPRLDLVGLDACLMGQLAVFNALQPYADVAVASEELVPGYGFSYDRTLNALLQQPTMDGPALGQLMVRSYMEHYRTEDRSSDAVGLAAINLQQLGGVMNALGNLAYAAQANPTLALPILGDARNNALTMGDGSLPPDDVDAMALVDLGDFASLVADLSANAPQLRMAAQSVVQAVNSAVLLVDASPRFTRSTGMTVYFPRTQELFNLAGIGNSYTSAVGDMMASWVTVLNTFYGTATQVLVEAPQLEITDVYPGLQTSIYQPVTLYMDVTGRDIAHVYFTVSYQLPSGVNVMLDYDELVSIEVTESGQRINNWEDGTNSVSFQWKGQVPVVSDGHAETYAVLVPTLDGELAVGAGLYRQAGSSDWIEASMVFDLDTREVVAIWGNSLFGFQVPFELTPQAGDQFQFYWIYLDAEGNFLTQETEEAVVLTFGDEPIRFEYRPAPDGTYLLGFVAEDMAGNSSYSSVRVTVTNSGLDAEYQGYTDADALIHFLYPADWFGPNSYQGRLLFGPSEGDALLTVYSYAGYTSAAEVAQVIINSWSVTGLTVHQQEYRTVNGRQWYLTSYSYQGDEGPRWGLLATVYVPENNAIYGFDLDSAADEYEQHVGVLMGVIETFEVMPP